MLSPITLSLIAAASAAYPDGLVADVLDANTGQRNPLLPGDTLAEFIAVEIAEVTRGEDHPEQAAHLAACAIERAMEELTAVGTALRRAEAGLPPRAA